MAKHRIFGYCTPWSVKPGDHMQFMVSAEGVTEARAMLVRLIHGDESPEGPGFVEEEVPGALPDLLHVHRQFTQKGSYAVAAGFETRDPASGGSFTIAGFICPTAPGKRRQTMLGRWDIHHSRGWGLGMNPDGHLEFWVGNGHDVDQITAEVPLVPRTWYFVAASFDAATRSARLVQLGKVGRYNGRHGPVVPYDHDSIVASTLKLAPMPAGAEVPLLWAGASDWNDMRGRFVATLYNGKIDRCGIWQHLVQEDELRAMASDGDFSTEGALALWDTTAGYTDQGIGDRIVDTGPYGLHAQGVNRPVRAMTGWNWAGRDDCFRLDPGQYGGVHFHDDALTDCRWAPTVEWTVPQGLKSGVYALRLTSDGTEDHVPFFVRAEKPKAPIAVLMSTFTYLAYANEHLAYEAPIAQAITAHTPILTTRDIDFVKLNEFGLSTYDHHSDGAGCCYSSWLRPILNIRPKYRSSAMGFPWALPADLSLIWWLENAGYDYEILTDHDLHAEGVAALDPYRVVINVTHPEYYSEAMMDATEDYLTRGGRVIYPGGNGYYWVSGLRDGAPEILEVRKLDAGSRAWQAEAGEGYLASTGERSGLWRSRGRAPQKIVGIGFTAEGMDRSTHFERMPDSFHKRVSWLFEGIGDTEKIGDFGLGLGGAAGIEIDRYDLELGTPPHTLLLGMAEGFSDNYPLVSEEITYAFPGRGGTQDPQVRADITWFTTANDGACLSIGSIAWSMALPVNNGQNSAARFMRNALDALIRPGPLPGAQWAGQEKLWR
ncbi:MAG: LamG domain-containing protein [Pararhodobacter sp.]|nr:LamG domain-containing protein [Pararhodobacter sp.]